VYMYSFIICHCHRGRCSRVVLVTCPGELIDSDQQLTRDQKVTTNCICTCDVGSYCIGSYLFRMAAGDTWKREISFGTFSQHHPSVPTVSEPSRRSATISTSLRLAQHHFIDKPYVTVTLFFYKSITTNKFNSTQIITIR